MLMGSFLIRLAKTGAHAGQTADPGRRNEGISIIHSERKHVKRTRTALQCAARAAFAALAFVISGSAAFAQNVTLTHVHGLAYSADGKQILIPSHHGLAVYSGGRWSKAPGPAHDFMGYSATKDRFYSSGHPAPGTGLTDPFGLIMSIDGGQTWQKRGLEGETDFHALGTSYETNAVYVFTPAPNSRMKQPGLYYTLNDGFAWKPSRAQGVDGAIHAIAVHPAKPQTVAVATKEGIFLSSNNGDRFDRVAPSQGLAVYFELDGEHLIFSRYDGKARLRRYSLKSRSDADISLPPLTQDAVSYIAQNPANRAEYAIATFERSVFLTRDLGKTWTQIARNGEGK
jgi:hypothetical protein